MPYYHRRPSNRELSGPYAYLNRQRIRWQVSLAPADLTYPWREKTGKVVRVESSDPRTAGLAFFIKDDEGCLYWIDPTYEQYRSIRVEGLTDPVAILAQQYGFQVRLVNGIYEVFSDELHVASQRADVITNASEEALNAAFSVLPHSIKRRQWKYVSTL